MLTRLHDLLGLRTGPVTFFVSVLVIFVFAAAMSLFPGPVQSGFGVVSVSGAMRVPRPAANSIRVSGWRIGRGSFR